MRKLVILGGGYGGMKIVSRLLTNDLPEDVSITLIDRNPYHSLKAEFHALAVGTISDKEVRVPFPKDPRLNFQCGEVTNIDLKSQEIQMNHKEIIPYDYLIIGLGSTDKFSHVPGAEQYAHSIQSIETAKETYKALNNLSPGSTVSIIGAGLSGVEFASELRDNRKDLKIEIYDRGQHILPSFPLSLSIYVENWFDNHHVDIINHANITRVEKNILYNYYEPIETDMIIWTAGIRPNPVVEKLNVEKDRDGRIVVTSYHNIPQYENVYVVGDCASLPYSPSAQLAEGQAEQIVQILLCRLQNKKVPKSLPPIKLKGVIGSLGKRNGFGILGSRPLMGRVPRIIKSGILWVCRFHNG